MRRDLGDARIELVQGDLVRQEVDAVVNAANAALAGGGGVDGAIHRAGGPSILAACRALPVDSRGRRCPPGEVRVTAAGELPCRWVIHGVGPIYRADEAAEAERLLRSVHEAALRAAADLGCTSIAFPAISTGAYGYPPTLAAPVALEAAAGFLREDAGPLRLVRFVLFGERDLRAFEAALGRLP